MKTKTPKTYFRHGLRCLLIILITAYNAYAQPDFGKSYVNVTKGVNGGTIEPGDTLEIRAAFVVKSGSFDSCSYRDLVPTGTAYIPGTIRILTNEGKIFRQFTDASGDDQGWLSGSTVNINLGFNAANKPATWARRGRVSNTDKPSFYGGTCIMIASFRVKVTASLGTILSTGGGNMTYKSGTSALTTYTFPSNTVAVYSNYGMCPNAVGTNALGTEFNGTFGSGQPRYRGPSPNVPPSYTYAIFTSGGPNDYYYGVANNTSTVNGYTTTNAWPIPDNSSPTHRVFNVWDIIGDHTGAANPLLGNSPADTVNNTNGGYMLVINASYRIDSAFQQTISNLCPNTYYEISCWMRNICSRCGCDSNGNGAGSVGYIPTAPNDSSGVYPNLTFEVDGIDYYTTGNIHYTGQWIKKGFTFLTGPTQTSFTLKFFNNAPGGGGNDWALDDITVATCNPNLSFNPSNQPTFCSSNLVNMGAYIRSYFNNYTYYKWQKSTDNGVTWADAGVSGTGTPTWDGSNWVYYTAYPTFLASKADSGTKFKVIVATTAANLANANCSFSDLSSILTLNVISCGPILGTDIISFSARKDQGSALLNWTTTAETGPLQFIVETSFDGAQFSRAAVLSSHGHYEDPFNHYSWSEPLKANGPVFYRIRMKGQNQEKISRVVSLSDYETLTEVRVPNPFTSKLTAFLTVSRSETVLLQLVNSSGQPVRSSPFTLVGGMNKVGFDNTGTLPSGFYTLQVRTPGAVLSQKVIKL